MIDDVHTCEILAQMLWSFDKSLHKEQSWISVEMTKQG